VTQARPPAKSRAFASPNAFRAWLERHHATSTELVVRCYKSAARERGMTYSEALDEALCYGWIDGVRRAFDASSFTVRFSPRKTRSRWSLVNTRRARELRRAGRMSAPGLAAFEARDPDDARRHSFESRPTQLAPSLLATLRANRRAWAFFQAQAPWYQRTASFWVMSAKRVETRERRLAVLLTCSRRRGRLPMLAPTAKRRLPEPNPRGRS
jgi:uncharacterized protein YdeI (YjbR/CyaY-like superfamily)